MQRHHIDGSVLGVEATLLPVLGKPSATGLHSQLCKCNILKYFLAMNVGPAGSEASHFDAVYAQHKAWHPLKVSCYYC